jgi:hypothetical protein
MMRRIALLVAVGIIAVAVAAPSAMAKSDLWSGNWLVGSVDKNGKRTSFGIIHLDLQPDDTTLRGTYGFSGGGSLVAELNHAFGPRMTGTYKDETGRGKFGATLDSSGAEFDGWYKPCRVFCRSRPWWGIRQ